MNINFQKFYVNEVDQLFAEGNYLGNLVENILIQLNTITKTNKKLATATSHRIRK